jgi:hypothetical protein
MLNNHMPWIIYNKALEYSASGFHACPVVVVEDVAGWRGEEELMITNLKSSPFIPLL